MKNQLVEALPMLRAFARSLCGNRDRADDLVQETVMRALANRDKFQEGTNLHAWLVTILRNQYYSEIRKRRREVEDSEGTHASRLSDIAAQPGHLELDDFLRAMRLLPDEQREALVLIGASGFSYEEAAEICGVRVGTVKSRVSRARSRLDEIMNGGVDLPGGDSAELSANEIAQAMRLRA
jgi:RNA polymerase sigma-70 factor (ECF subfamily)